MKKVLVLAAVLMLAATSAMALTIVNSKHDLSSGSTAATNATTNDEICIFCHTPHSADAAGFAPLWNRTTVNASAVYTGVDLQATITTNSVNASDAPLCLSCHDGASLADPLVNPANRFSVANNTAGLNNIPAANAANLGKDLRDDHPVGFNYDAVATPTDPEIRTRAAATTLVPSIQFFDGPTTSNGNYMWCSSCHDVHDNEYGAFLLTTNANSKLCLGCHDK